MYRAAFYLAAVLLCTLNVRAAGTYYWRTLPVGKPATAQMLTLFCRACGAGAQSGQDIPLVAVLRDTLGEQEVSTHRLTAVWLLSYAHPTIGQKALAAIPFFYWSPSNGSPNVKHKDTAPLLDLSAPEHPAIANVERQILQWTALDTLTTPVRATSRAYRTNEVDHERLHLEEANSYLLHAPVGESADQLTSDERDFVMARLELRKKLLGGFVTYDRVASLGKEAGFAQEQIRSRNWELLRQCAERTGLIFEPVRLAGSDEQYGILWFPARAIAEPSGANLRLIWKLLNIKDPYSDDRLTRWQGPTRGQRPNLLIPLGMYSLSYPRQPLLLVDFRDKLHVRRRDITQKSIDEITGGLVGLSHFANWYYFVASDLYNFIQERRGKANNRAERLDSYSEFRVALALDHDLDASFRREIEKRVDSLSSNPLESSPANEMSAALDRFSLLTIETHGDDGRLLKRIDNQRRAELAAFGASPRRQGVDLALHAVTLGTYTRKAKPDEENLSLLSTYRRVENNLEFLDKLVAAGTPPEVVYPQSRVLASVNELSELMTAIDSKQVRQHAQQTLKALSDIPVDEALRASCLQASRALDRRPDVAPLDVPAVVAAPPGLTK